jgi:hypothetical protein
MPSNKLPSSEIGRGVVSWGIVTTVVVALTVVVVRSVVGDAVTTWVSAVEPPLSASTAPVIDNKATPLRPSMIPGRPTQSFAFTPDYRQAKEVN